MVAQQVGEDLERRRACNHCGRRHTTKDSGTSPLKTLFGVWQRFDTKWAHLLETGPFELVALAEHRSISGLSKARVRELL